MQRAGMKRQLIGSSFYRVLENLINVATALLLTPILLAALGTSQYGLWLLLLSVIFIFPVFDFGFATAIQRAMAQAIERQDACSIQRLFSTGMLLFAGLAVPALLCTFLLATNPAWLGVEPDFRALATFALLILLIKVVTDMIANAMHGIYSGHLRFDLDAKISIVQTILRSVLMVVFVTEFGLMALVFATLGTDLLAHLARFVLGYRLQPDLRCSWQLVSWRAIKELYVFGRHVFLLDASRIIRTNSEPLLISHLLNLSAVSFYAVADRLVRQAEMLTRSVLGSLQPFLIRKQHSGMLTEQIAAHSIQLSLFFHGVLLLSGLVCGPIFIELWLGQGFGQSQQLLPVLFLAVLFKAYTIPLSQLFIAHACHHKLVPLHLIGAVLQVGFMLLLGSLFGLMGIAWAAVVINALVFTAGLCVQANRILQLPWTAMLPGLLSLSVLFTLAFLLSMHLPLWRPEASWLEFLVKAPVIVITAALVCYYSLIRAPLRGRLQASLQELISKQR
ncbi:lipopolysaccharide biosynthesis protein [Alkalimonas mucilaginosa]|uniref:Oligosaccharide flippase family protein n=1 Tax=Alkalimonas mucilaginosa TaxID=3057676 RepID=A0ABU7JB32_9GAMM|nr:oligosaccharide flippase family protein [Alkalimonas sp. MEB004]MEE2022902.1 oligosaccharide flippase family protein [Alkalimonas sp. MEB004]